MRAAVAGIETAFAGRAVPPRTRLDICRHLLGLEQSTRAIARILDPLCQLLSSQPPDEQHYWISTFSTLLMRPHKRAELAAYFTPPPIVRHLLAQAEHHGLDLKTAEVIDPAAGGAAFVSSLAGRMRELGCHPWDIKRRLFGIELDRHLARLGELLVSQRLGNASIQQATFQVADALFLSDKFTGRFDAVFVNPPYGRAFDAVDNLPPDWEQSSALGHVNKYALFIGLALRLAKPGGIVGVVAPSSFIAGPSFGRLRSTIRTQAEVLRVDVLERKHVFYEVQQDACVSLMRRLDAPKLATYAFRPTCAHIDRKWDIVHVGHLTASTDDLSAPWVLPSQHGEDVFQSCSGRLSDYGVTAKAGYFVWNRQKQRMSRKKSARKPNFPLIWANNIKAGKLCTPRAREGHGVDYVTIAPGNSVIIKSGAIFLQRTTNNKQPRRLVAGRIAESLVKRLGGVVSENHTIAILPSRENVRLSLLCKLLNSKSVDDLYRRVGGTASISVSSLRDLPLPFPEDLERALQTTDDFDLAVERAYRFSALGTRKRDPVPV